MKDQRPRCPKCGEPARQIKMHAARVICELLHDGTPGDIIWASHPCDVGGVEYICGGGHTWKVAKDAP